MNHRPVAKFGYYSLFGLAGSALVQIANVWPQTWLAVGGLALIVLLYFMLLLISLCGVLRGARWASSMSFDLLGIDAIESTAVVLFFVVGGAWTCLRIL